MLTTHDLSQEDCARLLGTGVVGRVGISTPTGPHIIPVNYAVHDESVLVRTTAYSLLGTYGRDAWLCFEVDHLDHEHERGWSVAVRGRADFVVDHDELARLASGWGPSPWAAGLRTLVVRIPWTEVTGRRLGTDRGTSEDMPDHLRVRRPA